jgi:hypothetical protein
VGGLCLDGTADRAEVHGLFFDFEAELLREGGAHDVDGAGVEDRFKWALAVNLHLEGEAALSRNGDLAGWRHRVVGDN